MPRSTLEPTDASHETSLRLEGVRGPYDVYARLEQIEKM
jgi:hypothetical protein